MTNITYRFQHLYHVLGWCSWLSRLSNTQKVPSSSLGPSISLTSLRSDTLLLLETRMEPFVFCSWLLRLLLVTLAWQ